MKKIFLTSGVIVCMACPAFATGESWSGATSGTQSSGCTEPNLGVYSGPTQMDAQWTPNYTEMLLNENVTPDKTVAAADAQGGATNATHAPKLYLVGGDGVYTRSGSSDANYVFTKLAADDVAIDTVPTGVTVNYILHQDKPSGATGTVTAGSSTGKARVWQSYVDASDATKVYITRDATTGKGKLTSAGVTAAASYNNTSGQWKATYSKITPTVTNPTLYGYSFKGWSTSAANATAGTVISNFSSQKIGHDTDIYASWKANTYTVKYNCGAGDSGSTAPGNATATYDQSFTWASNNDSASSSCKKNGYHFTGWTCTVAASDTTNNTQKTIISNGGVQCGSGATAPGACTGQPISGSKWTETNLKDGATVTCTAQYATNTIQPITWNGANADSSWTAPTGVANTNSCTYGGAITLPTQPTRVGYTFGGWKKHQ